MIDQRAATNRRDHDRAVDSGRDLRQRIPPAFEIDVFQRDQAFVLAGEIGQHRRESLRCQRAHRERQRPAQAVRLVEQRRDDQNGGAARAGRGDAEQMLCHAAPGLPQPFTLRSEKARRLP